MSGAHRLDDAAEIQAIFADPERSQPDPSSPTSARLLRERLARKQELMHRIAEVKAQETTRTPVAELSDDWKLNRLLTDPFHGDGW